MDGWMDGWIDVDVTIPARACACTMYVCTFLPVIRANCMDTSEALCPKRLQAEACKEAADLAP